MLTAAGAAATGIAGSASAELVDIFTELTVGLENTHGKCIVQVVQL